MVWRATVSQALAAALLPRALFAVDLSGSATIVSDYDYRGVTQSANGPALQLETDYVIRALHFEAWTSNVQFSPAKGVYDAGHTEISYSADATFNADGHLRYNIGLNYFTYAGLHPYDDYAEVAATVGDGPLSSSFHYTWDYAHSEPQLAAYYEEVNGTWPLYHTHLSALAHAGVSWGPYWNADNRGAYADYSIGLEGSWHAVIVMLQGINTRGYQSIPRDSPFSGKEKLLLSITITTASE